LTLIDDIAQAMTLTSICGLGQVASNAITSTIKYFSQDVEKYLR
jgi:NADH:ubiquinone oxidoreductase subunit F (NADH-binding)